MDQKRFWLGKTPPTHCQISKEEITDKFYDACVRGGPWAIMCPAAFKRFGIKLGTGYGQEYTKQPDGRWMKTGG